MNSVVDDLKLCLPETVNSQVPSNCMCTLFIISAVPDYGRPESIQAETEWEHTL